jgi:uncharacterized membrane protein
MPAMPSAQAPRPQAPATEAAAAARAARVAASVSAPASPHEPDVFERMGRVIRDWFTTGTVPVKIGVLVLFAGVAAALRYAAMEGYFTFPIEFRLATIAAGGIAALAWGFRERTRRPAFGLSLQGGAIGVLLLTVFATYKLYHLLPPGMAFALVVLLVAGSAVLALLQDAVALAVLGFLGGYLAPVLISTGSHDHVALFSYYAVLNAAVFAVSWKRAWRLLNLIGFAFTFGVGTAWGVQYYKPEMFATVEPFLVLFFLFYVVIGLLYVLRQTTHRKPWVDGTLVFGTPLLAFPLQAGLLKDDRMGLALSALAVAFVYVGLLAFLRNRRSERLLTEAYGALAIGFATLAVPLAFSAGTTASVWALEGAGIAWLGIRQNRTFPWVVGLLLQGMAAVAYLIGFADNPTPAPDALLLLNPHWLGAAILAFAAYALSLIHERLRPVAALPQLLFAWATAWWAFGGIDQMVQADGTLLGAFRFGLLYLAVTVAAAALLRKALDWQRLELMPAIAAIAGFFLVFVATSEFGAPLQVPTLGAWAAYLAAMAYALWTTRGETSHPSALAQLVGLWTIATAATIQLGHVAEVNKLAQGWEFLCLVAPVALMTLGLWKAPQLVAWPRADATPTYRPGWFVPAACVLALAWLIGLFAEGSAAPLPTLPLLNPLELGMAGIAFLLYGYGRERADALRPALQLWPFAAFAFVTQAVLRAVHHLHGEPWGPGVLDSAFSQAALTLVWSLIGVGLWVLGSRRANRHVWWGGAILMGVVLAKLVLVDRHYMGNLAGIVSFLVVGALMVGVGWIAPSPPRNAMAAPEPEAA